MAYGAILGQTPIIPENPETTATNVSYNNASTSSIITGSNVQQAIDQLFTSVSNGKQQIASAITDKGVSTSGTDSFATMAENIGKIAVGKQVNVYQIQNQGDSSRSKNDLIIPNYKDGMIFYFFLSDGQQNVGGRIPINGNNKDNVYFIGLLNASLGAVQLTSENLIFDSSTGTVNLRYLTSPYNYIYTFTVITIE